MHRTYIFALITILLSACSNFKNSTIPDNQIDMSTYGKTNQHHQVLKDFSGKWIYKASFWSTPNAKPKYFEGINEMEMIYDARFLKYQSKSKSGAEGVGYIGYNNLKQKYETFWIDNMATGMMKGEGQFNIKTRTLVGTGEYSDPSQKSKIQKFNDEWKIVNKDQLIYTQYIKNDQYSSFKQIEIHYQRKNKI